MHDPKLLPIFIFGTLVVSAFTFAVIISIVIQKQRQVKSRLARQKMEFDYSQSLLNTRLEVQETTLNMLAQELHDNITQSLTGCYMQFNIASGMVNEEGGKVMLNDAKEHLLEIISNVRMLSHSLATGMVEQRSLEEAIQAELNRIQTFSSIKCSLQSESLHELAPEQRLITFRILQEALQNVLKHAHAQSIVISIDETDADYLIRIEDDGKGFDADGAKSGGSLGLMSMEERAQMLKGDLKVYSQPGQGTTINLAIPLIHPDEKDKRSDR